MEQEHKNIRPLLLAAIAAVTVIAILLVFFISGRKRSSAQTIVLPDPPAQEEVPAPEQTESAGLAEVSKDNVQSILEKSVSRPASYHQTMQLVTAAGERQRVQTAEVWVKGKLLKVQLTDEFETKTVLADEQTLYLWYEDETLVQMARGAGMRLDDLAGVPSYEDILTYSRSQIMQASFVSLPDTAGDCIYVSAGDGQTEQDYWVSLESGLLCKQTKLDGGELVYQMEQTALEVFPENDEALDGVFTLPDGTDPFAEESQPGEL